MYVRYDSSCRLPAARPAVGREVPRSHPSPSVATAPATAAPRRVPHRQRHAGKALGRLGEVAGARGPPSGPGAPRLASHAYIGQEECGPESIEVGAELLIIKLLDHSSS